MTWKELVNFVEAHKEVDPKAEVYFEDDVRFSRSSEIRFPINKIFVGNSSPCSKCSHNHDVVILAYDKG